MIEFSCPHCSHKIKAQMNATGIQIKCPRCKANIAVPMPERSEPIFEEDNLIEDPKQPGRSEFWVKFLVVVGLLLFILIAPRLVPRNSGNINRHEVSQEQSRQLNEEIQQNKSRPDMKFIKKWMVPGDFVTSAELWEKNGQYNLVHSMSDGSKWTQRVAKKSERLIPDQNDYPGEYYIINQNGDLESWDRDGKISTSTGL